MNSKYKNKTKKKTMRHYNKITINKHTQHEQPVKKNNTNKQRQQNSKQIKTNNKI